MPRGGGSYPPQHTHGHNYPQSHIPQPAYQVELYLRSQAYLRGLPANVPVHLDSLQNPKIYTDRPPYTMQELAAVAIMSHPKKRASSSEIRDMLMRRYRYFNDNPKELGETLKHELSSSYLFKRVERTVSEPGRGGLWELDVLTNPDGRRPRHRGSGEGTQSPEFSTMGDDF
ncbi:hypothetical protein CPB85DRAFT_1435759 [Mucidula mucida]|nr:hypothetical protein CPB85DRAFT_1435759 [Mucidula mucida]